MIASRVGAYPEVIADGKDGFLVDVGDSAALAEAMKKLARRPELALAMGRSGWDKVNERFSKKRHYEGLMKVYTDAKKGNR